MKRYILAGLAVVLLAAFFFSPSKAPEQEQKLVKIDLAGQGMADANDQKIAYFQVTTDSQTPIDANVSWQIFAQPIPNQIYELDGPRIEATQYAQFHEVLETQLKSTGKGITPVTLQNLNSMQPGSFLLITSGILPETLLKDGILEKLIERNTTILYIGLPFDVTMAPDGAPVKNKDLWKNYTKKLGIEFTEVDQSKARNHSFSKRQYGVRLNTENNATRIYINDATIYSVSYQNQGTLAFIPNTIDNGWKNATLAAEDVLKIIQNGQWQPQLAERTASQILMPGQNTLISPPFNSKQAYAQIAITSENGTKRFASTIQTLAGQQINPIEAAPGETVTTSATLYANFPHTKQLNLSIQAVQNGNTTQTISVGMAAVKTIGFASTSFTAPTEAGDYLLQLKDQDDGIHAQSILHVTNMTARFIREDYGDGAFSVQILKDGQPQANTPYRISLDGANNKTLTTDENGIASFNTKASLQPTHALAFYGSDHYFQIERPHIDAGFLNSPIAYAIIFLIIAIFGFGFLFAVKSKTKFHIDIPDFPNETAQNRSIHKQDVIHAFERANHRFKRQNAPLTLTEVKEALKEQLDLPNRTTLTDNNIQTLLNELEKQKTIKAVHGYYTLAKWEDKSRKTAEYLTLKRMVLDELIRHGRPFQETSNESIKTDFATYHLFEPKSLANLEARLKKDKGFLVFPTPHDVQFFIQQLKTNTESLHVRLYLELTHGTFHAISVEQIGKELK